MLLESIAHYDMEMDLGELGRIRQLYWGRYISLMKTTSSPFIKCSFISATLSSSGKTLEKLVKALNSYDGYLIAGNLARFRHEHIKEKEIYQPKQQS